MSEGGTGATYLQCREDAHAYEQKVACHRLKNLIGGRH